jgi:8-oxo-dGTP diphosphatase
MSESSATGEVRVPEIAVGAIAIERDCLLMIRRGRGAAAGQWSIPGGRVELGETLASAVVRETLEETGLEVVCDRYVGWVERIDDSYHYVIHDFLVTVLDGGNPQAGDDASEACWIPFEEITNYNVVDGLIEFLAEHQILRVIP